MSAASYIGRVGGLAVALGVGTAILTGQGVANATTDGENSDGTSGGGTTNGETTNDTTTSTDSGGLGKIENKLPKLSDIIGRHRTDETTPSSVTATSIVKRLSDTAKRITDAVENAVEAGTSAAGDNVSVSRATQSGGGSSLSDRPATRTTKRTPAPDDTATADDPTGTNNVVASQVTNQIATVKDWISSPLAVAGRSVEAPEIPQPSTLWTPPRLLAPLGTMKAAPSAPSAVGGTTTLLTTVLSAFNPLAGNGTTAPGVSPLGMVVAGAARREIGVESLASVPLLAPTTDSLTYDPEIDLVHGVVSGVNTPSSGVSYLVVSQPSGGGKVYVDPTTGDFTYLPDLSSVQHPDNVETFKVVAVENTAFTSALTSIPLVGPLVDKVLIVLYQVPVLNVVLSPIIGKSEITQVSIALNDVDGYDPGDPVAFTVMVPSDDGVMISTNYFPAWSVADPDSPNFKGTAPTILNGPGLATAGNINPDAPYTVDGLVPGIEDLTSHGYNVVTWDPRGEFDSTGRLELDSPQYEGADVSNIITWITDHPEYTYQAMEDPATDDPWIGMVGGSYGGGIQLVSAVGDNRIDVIVPGIAWNTLTSSLYPNEAFKTSYSSLLLLSLVTTGARINPQIYGGIITGAVLGILLPSQQALLARSGPGQTVRGISVPTLLIQGTVDVLFPLQQAVKNADLITDQANAPEVNMIWYCGGHGVCLTMDKDQLAAQNQFLLNNTLAWLDNALPEADDDPNNTVTIPKFQWVDQNGDLWKADTLPSDDAFYGTPLTGVIAPDSGGHLVIVPILGGSGPQSEAGFPASLGLGAPASNAITVPITVNESDVPDGTKAYVVGSPHLTFDYSGIGTSRHVYAQLVDKDTGLVVGNIVTPVDVTLDGRNRQAEVDMEDVAWTYTNPNDPNDHGNLDDLELQIVGSSTAYENLTEYGYINVSNVQLTLPTAGSATHEDWPAVPEPVSA